MVKYLVGNCADLNSKEEERDKTDVYSNDSEDAVPERSVTKAEALACMREHGFSQYIETSAKTGENVEVLFTTLAKHLFLRGESWL